MPSGLAEPVRLARGLAVAVNGAELIVEGGPRRCVFRGRAATGVLPGLMAALDGSRSLARVRADTGLTAAQLAQALDLLDRHRLLEPGAAPGPARHVPDEVDAHFSRVASTHRQYPGARQLVELLAGTAVHLVGDPPVTARVRADLRGCGVGTVSVGDAPGDADTARLRAADRALVVVVDEVASAEPLATTVAWGWREQTRVLRVAAAGGFLEIGPCFATTDPICPECLHRSRLDAGWGHTADAAAGTTDLLAALTADAVVAIACRLPGMPPPGVVTRTAVADWSTERYLVTGYRTCRRCGDRNERCDQQTALVEQFHRGIQIGPTDAQPLPEQSAAWSTRVADHQHRRPGFGGHPSQPCPPITATLMGTFGAPAAGHRRPDHQTLADVVCRVAGLRGPAAEGDGHGDRWAPTGGDLGSVEVYLIVEAGLPELPGTVFRYDDLRHRFVAVRPDRPSVADALAGTDLPTHPADPVLVLVAAHRRASRKYREFAHHLVHLDAGCATTQLAAVAGGHGLVVEHASRWGERLAALLSLEDGQYVTAVAAVRPGQLQEEPCP